MAKKAAKKTGTTRKKTGASKQSGARKKTGARKTAGSGKKAATRELVDTGTDKRFVRRRASGTFKESDDVGRSLTTDRRKKAKTAAKRGQGDKGDRRA